MFLNDAPVTFQSATQMFVTLSVMKAESAVEVMMVQDMLYIYHLLKSLELEKKSPMLLEMDNKGAVDLVNNWSMGGRTCHKDVQLFSMRA